MDLVLLRHGQTEWNVERRIQGVLDVPLNEKGRRQIQEICEKNLIRLNVSWIISSPLERAVESARICSRVLGIPMEVSDDFAERSFGSLQGRTLGQIRREFGVRDAEEMMDGRFGVEDMASLNERLIRGTSMASARFPEGKVLLVTHGSIIRCLARAHGADPGIIENGAFVELKANESMIEYMLKE